MPKEEHPMTFEVELVVETKHKTQEADRVNPRHTYRVANPKDEYISRVEQTTERTTKYTLKGIGGKSCFSVIQEIVGILAESMPGATTRPSPDDFVEISAEPIPQAASVPAREVLQSVGLIVEDDEVPTAK